MRSTAYIFGSVAGSLLLGAVACSDPNEGAPPTTIPGLGGVMPTAGSGAGSTAGAGSQPTMQNTANTGTGDVITSNDCIGAECGSGGNVDANKPAPPGCGDGVRSDDEACDDGVDPATGASKSGDGCSANCLVVEPGFSCAEPGKPCLPIALCGDGIVAASEQCDDGLRVSGDGCDDTCKFEKGFTCEGAPSVCRATTCGDMIQEGAESCDDGNRIPFDGCSDECEREPACPGSGGACSSECGDGIKIGINEECDDGNNLAGDGCSPDCKTEAGFTCTEEVVDCEETIGGDCVIRVPVLYRDFGESHPDFGENPSECKTTFEDGGEEIPGNVVTTGMVEATLDADGRPVLASGLQDCENNPDGPNAGQNLASYQGISSATTFAQWFRDDSTVNLLLPGELILFENGDGGYVNRFNDNGDQFDGYVPGTETGGDDFECSWCLSSDCSDRCTADEETYDGSPLFFPIDDAPATFYDRGAAKVPAEYGYTGWPWEGDVPGLDDVDHNFYFTTQVQTWFEYTADIDAQLDFTGDDDVWVFVNGRLALDLGGIHAPEDGSVSINSRTATTYGLEVGQVYSLVVFQAERRMEGSSFRLTLSGFNPSPSVCKAECGDGIVSFGEECDEGAAGNVGGYGKCSSECRLGEFCGDGIVNGDEECEPSLGGSEPCVACRILEIQ